MDIEKLIFCDSKVAINILICKNCDNFYIGQTQDFKQKFAKDKSDGKCQKPAQQALQDMFRTA